MVKSLSLSARGSVIRVQVLDQVDCISHSTDIHRKGMNPIILPPAMGKYEGWLGCLALLRRPVMEKKNSQLKPFKLRLKIDLVSHPLQAEGLVNTFISLLNSHFLRYFCHVLFSIFFCIYLLHVQNIKNLREPLVSYFTVLTLRSRLFT